VFSPLQRLLGVNGMHNPSILDDLDVIRRVDRGQMLERYRQFPKLGRDAIHQARELRIPERVKVSRGREIRYGTPGRVMVVGVGGSAVSGDLLQGWLGGSLSTPIHVCRDYALPAYADENTLILAISYSGNTEETLSAFVEAVKRGCMVISISSGGRLHDFARRLKLPHLLVPGGIPPRAALPALFFPLPILLERLGVLSGVEDEVTEAVEVLDRLAVENAPEIPVNRNLSKRLAVEIAGTIPIVYGFRQYGAVARRLKTQFNENSKIPSWYDVFPELSHNEVMSWEAPHPTTERLSVILIRDPAEPPEIRLHIETVKALISKRAWRLLEIHAVGEGSLAKMFSTLYVGDLTSIYLAILRGVDPTPIRLISRVKEELRALHLTERLEGEVRLLAEH